MHHHLELSSVFRVVVLLSIWPSTLQLLPLYWQTWSAFAVKACWVTLLELGICPTDSLASRTAPMLATIQQALLLLFLAGDTANAAESCHRQPTTSSLIRSLYDLAAAAAQRHTAGRPPEQGSQPLQSSNSWRSICWQQLRRRRRRRPAAEKERTPTAAASATADFAAHTAQQSWTVTAAVDTAAVAAHSRTTTASGFDFDKN